MSADTRLEELGVSGLGKVDEPAFSGLAERHRRELHVHCYRMLGSFEDAEDAVQETFLRAWRRRETFEGRSTFRAWLYRIATNACLDAIARRPKRVLPIDYGPPSGPGEEAGRRAPIPLAPSAGKAAEAVLAKNYVDINAHMVAHIAHREKGDADKSKYHRAWADGLLDSVKSTGDGMSIDKAFEVISISEEYALFQALGVRRLQQSLMRDKGHAYDAVVYTVGNSTEIPILVLPTDRSIPPSATPCPAPVHEKPAAPQEPQTNGRSRAVDRR